MSHGQVRAPTVTEPVASAPTLPLSSLARARRVTGPVACGVQVYDQVALPLAGCQVAPPSVDTSTPPTTPPVSLAVPAMVAAAPTWKVEPAGGGVIDALGPVVSVDAV